MDQQRSNTSADVPTSHEVPVVLLWSPDEIQALVTLWASKSVQEQLLNPKNKEVFIEISTKLASLGYHRGPIGCRNKIHKLKSEYEKIKEHNYSRGISEHNGAVWFALMDDVMKYQPGVSSINDDAGVPRSHEVPLGLLWSPDEIQALVTIWASKSVQQQLLNSRTKKNKKVFIGISTKLASLGYHRDPARCRIKIQRLKLVYKNIKERNYSRGISEHNGGVWFSLMDDVLKYQPGESSINDAAGDVSVETDAWFKPVESSQPPSPSCLQSDTDKSDANARLSWTEEETRALLDLWGNGCIQEQLNNNWRTAHIYSLLSDKLSALGFHKTPRQCQCKIKKLKCDYRRKKANTGSKLRGSRLWFGVVDAVLGRQEVDLDYPGTSQDDVAEKLDESSQDGSPEKVDNSEKSPCWPAVDVPHVHGNQAGSLGFEAVNCVPGSAVQDSFSLTNHNELSQPGVFSDVGPSSELTLDTSMWLPDETQLFLTSWGEPSIQEQLNSTLRNQPVFRYLSKLLASAGFHKTPQQCKDKLKHLKRTYWKIKTSQVPLKYLNLKWFSIMDAVLSSAQENEGSEREEPKMDFKTCSTAEPDPPLTPEECEEDRGSWVQSQATIPSTPPQTIPQQNCSNRNRCRRSGMKLSPPHRTEEDKDGQSDHSIEEEECAEVTLSDEEWVPEVCSKNKRKINETTEKKGRPNSSCSVKRSGGQLTCSTLSLMVPTLRMMSAFAWQVVQCCNVMHYGKVEELVQLVTEVVPHLLSHREKVDLLLRLRARPAPSGHRYEADLQALVWEFISRLDKLLPLPDIKQTAKLLNAAPSLLEECGQLKFEPAQLKTLLHHHTQQEIAKECSWVQSQATIPSTPPQTIPQQNCSNRKRCRRSGMKLSPPHRTEEDKDGQSDHSIKEEEGAEVTLSDEEWVPEDCSKNKRKINETTEKKGRPNSSCSVNCSGVGHITAPRLHTCSLCSFTHSQEDGLLQHIRQEHTTREPSPAADSAHKHNDLLHRCSHCGADFTTHKRLTSHMAIHTVPFHCDQCDKHYRNKHELMKHQRVHTGERPFTCTYCGRGFRCSWALQTHVPTHTGERRFSCHICGKTSIQHLVRHMLMHKGEKNYLCTECGKAFLSSGELRLHTRTHTGERPYTCKLCGKGFIAKCHLTVHLRTHTGEKPYRCMHCAKAFSTSGRRKRHMLIHSDKKPFSCFKCGKGFVQSYQSKLHIRKCMKEMGAEVAQG